METDGIEEAFEGQLRVLLTAAGQVGERIARAREDALRQAQARSEQEFRELQSRIAAERHAARVELAGVHGAEWWDRATPEQIGRTYQLACAWAQEDLEAVRAEQRMRDEVRTRYGIDVNDAGADPDAVRQLIRLEMERAERDRAEAEVERGRSAAEAAEAQQVLTHADQEDQRSEAARAAAEHEPDPDERVRAAAEAEQREATAQRAREEGRTLYDSAERRDGTARELESKGMSTELVATRMRADVSQAQPATEAVSSGAPGRTPKARRTRRGRATQSQRTGPSR